REASDGIDVALDVGGPGVLSFARANHWHGSPWHYVVDGVDHVVTESSTATPDAPVTPSSWRPGAPFPRPLPRTWSTPHGADLSWVPVPFTTWLSIGYGRSHYGTGYFIVHAYPEVADNLSSPIDSWDEAAPPDDVMSLLGGAGGDIAPPGDEHAVTIAVPAAGTLDPLHLP